MKITILGWKKINARKDVDNPSWFKFKHKFFSDTEFYEFSHEEKLVWIYLLCEASKKNDDGKFTLSELHAHTVARLSVETVRSTLKKLKAIHVIDYETSRRRNANVTDAGVRQEEKREEERRGEERLTPPSAPALPPLAKIWNDHRGTLPEVKGCSGTRRRQAEARWRDNPSTEYWAEIVSRIARSPFCSGDNERGWRASFDFLIRPETQHKVQEGRYDAAPAGKAQAWVDPEIARMRQRAAEEDSYGT
jgi:hypothetical protein